MRRAWRSFLAVRFDRFPSYRNYRWGDSSSFFGPNMASEAISVPNFKKFSWGSMPPDPPSFFTLKRMQWPYQSKIVGAGPVKCCTTCSDTIQTYSGVCFAACLPATVLHDLLRDKFLVS